MNLDDYLRAIGDDAGRLAACAESGDLETPIDACPGWDLRALVAHLGGIHRWATIAVQQGAPPKPGSFEMPADGASGDVLGAWLRRGAGELVEVLAATPADADTWHPFPFEQKAWVWNRRQAHETAMHRWDGERAIHGQSTLDPAFAADGLAEFFEMLLPRTLGREQTAAPDASLHVHCTDDGLAPGAGEWIVWGEGGEYRMEAVHRKGDAALRGSACDLLLALMGRTDGATLELAGDEAAAAAWFDLPGL